MIRIGYIVSSLNYGGVEKYVVDLANNIDRSIFDPIIFSLSSHIPLSSQLNSNTRVHTFERKKGNDPGLWLQLSKKISQEKIDVLHSNNWSTYLETVAAKLLSRKSRLIHVQHGMEANEAQTQRKKFVKNRLRQACTFFTDQVAVVSEATKSFVQTEWYTPPNKIRLIYNGVDTDFFKPASQKQIDHFKKKLGITNTSFIIGSVGRLMKVKNYAMLIRAFSMIVRKSPDIKLVLVGDGPEKRNLQDLAQNQGIENQILFAGTTSDVRSFLQVMDIFVLPSFSEGVSLSLLEAMAAGCPAIATAVGGNTSVINSFQNGILVPSDNPTAMAHALENLIKDHSIYESLQENSRKTVINRFSLKQMVHHYQQLYRELHRT